MLNTKHCHLHVPTCTVNNIIVAYRGAKLWNSLPENLRNKKPYTLFKKSFRIIILSFTVTMQEIDKLIGINNLLSAVSLANYSWGSPLQGF